MPIQKKIMGYDLSDTLAAQGAIRALRMAVSRRQYHGELIHHSDRGVQYCCNDYQKVLGRKKIKVSMTESYDPYANAIAERVNGILKDEFMLEEIKVGVNDLSKIVAQSIYIYNTKRPHFSCGLLTPEQMHLQAERIKPKYSKKREQTIAYSQFID
jgi:transposase InsO family protein